MSSPHIAYTTFNRWRIPPAALAIHLCIGMAYGFSVFWLPLSQALGISKPILCSDLTLAKALFTRSCDWRVSDLGWIYTFFFMFIGFCGVFGGIWLEKVGPRKVAFLSMAFWCGGLLLASLGVFLHQLWIIWFGAGVFGGIGLGLGYISPLSMLIKWFPDRRGMATGLAMMGFGGGAIIGAPMADIFISYFRTSDDVGVWQTFFLMSCLCCLFMSWGAWFYRLPSTQETVPDSLKKKNNPILGHVSFSNAHKTVPFWLIWVIFFLNSSAGLGMTGVASPMFQEIFGGALLGKFDISLAGLDSYEKATVAALAAGFTGFLFLFSLIGRFLFPFLSDYTSRKGTYCFLFLISASLYALLPTIAQFKNQSLFTLVFCAIMISYGGAIALVPAFLSDIFGTRFIGAIHGKLLSASIFSGIAGPVLVNYLREFYIARGFAQERAYDTTLYILSCFMIVGFFATLCVKPLDEKWFIKEELSSSDSYFEKQSFMRKIGSKKKYFDPFLFFSWFLVLIPFLWGIWFTFKKALLVLL